MPNTTTTPQTTSAEAALAELLGCCVALIDDGEIVSGPRRRMLIHRCDVGARAFGYADIADMKIMLLALMGAK
jgi:hypothetical protein